MTVRVSDPFGLVELGRAFRTTVPLTVTPRTVPLADHPARRRLDRLRRQPAARVRDRQRRGRHRPRVPPRRRPAPRALAQLGPGRRADGAPRGAALAVAGDAVPRQPAWSPTAARASPPRSRPRSRPPRRSPSTSASAASPSGWSPPPARTPPAPGTSATPTSTPVRCSRRSPSSRPLQQARLDTGWLTEAGDGGLIVAVLGAVDATTTSRCCAGCSTTPARRSRSPLDVDAWSSRDRPRRRRRRDADASRAGASVALGPRDRLEAVWQELGRPARRAPLARHVRGGHTSEVVG